MLIILLVFVGGPALAKETKDEEAATPKECASCTARHKSLQALQKARVPSKTTEADQEKTDE